MRPLRSGKWAHCQKIKKLMESQTDHIRSNTLLRRRKICGSLWNTLGEQKMMWAAGYLIAVIWLAASSVGGGCVSLAQSQQARETPISLSTQDRLEDMSWWPTKGAA